MRTRRGVAALALVAGSLLAGASGSLPAAAATPTSVPELGPLISGQSSYVTGTHVWTGYAYNDKGASTAASGPGTATYPAGVTNAANLIQLQLATASGGTRVTAILETLTDASLPLLGVGFNTDGSTRTGAVCLPGGSWTCKGALGLERLLVADSRGARVMEWTGATWRQLGRHLATKVSLADNTVSTTIPTSQLRSLASAPTKVVGALGLTTSSWLTGGPIYNLAYVRDTRFTQWNDTTQGDVLAGRLASSLAVATVDPRVVSRHTTQIPPLRPGYYAFLYHSTLRLAEGIGPAITEGPLATAGQGGNYYLGPYQPYGVWVSAHLPKGPAPLLVILHGAGPNHLAALSDFKAPPGVPAIPGQPASTVDVVPGESSGLFDVPGIMISPLARGESTYDWGIAEQDVLDAVDDVRRRLGTDPERQVLSGISLGSLSTWRIGELYPDRWSSLVPIVAASEFPPEFVFVGRHIFPNAIENVGSVPIRALGGRLDPLADPFTGLGQERDFVNMARLGYDIRFWSFLRRNHEVVPGPSNCVMLEMLRQPRVKNPARVVYTTEPGLEMSNRASGLDLSYRSAYWVSGLVSRGGTLGPATPPADVISDPTSRATIDVVSLARKDRVTTSTLEPLVVGENRTTPSNVCGTQESVFSGYDSWYEQRNNVIPGPAQPVSNGLELTLTNLSAAAFDLSRASVSTAKPVTLEVTGDGPATLALTGPWAGPVTVTRDGESFASLKPGSARLSLKVDFNGTHTFVLTPSARTSSPPSSATAAERSLAATGWGAAVPAGALSLLVLVGATCRRCGVGRS